MLQQEDSLEIQATVKRFIPASQAAFFGIASVQSWGKFL